MRSLLILSFLIAAMAAADPAAVGAWRTGDGTVAGNPVSPGAAIADGAAVTAGATGPVELSIDGAPRSVVRLSPGATARFIEQAGAPKPTLVVELDAGAIEVDLPDRGRWAGMHVRGGALNVQVVGTLFVVERARRDTDFVAVMRGRVKVGLRSEVARLLGAAGAAEVELGPRQGVEGNARSGLGQVETVQSRPSVVTAASVASQARTPDPDDRTWIGTPAIEPTVENPVAVTPATVTPGGGPLPEAVPPGGVTPGTELVTVNISDEVMQAVTVEVGASITETVTNTITEQVLTGTNTVSELGLPPGPPN